MVRLSHHLNPAVATSLQVLTNPPVQARSLLSFLLKAGMFAPHRCSADMQYRLRKARYDFTQ